MSGLFSVFSVSLSSRCLCASVVSLHLKERSLCHTLQKSTWKSRIWMPWKRPAKPLGWNWFAGNKHTDGLGNLGHCEHAIRIPGDYRCKGVRLGRDLEYVGYAAYEIGVVKRRDGRPGYLLLWDHWAGGCGLMDFVGGRFDSGQFEHDGRMPKLKQAYARAAALRVAQAQGFRVREEVSANGGIRMFLTK
jgi:hypothetical protein